MGQVLCLERCGVASTAVSAVSQRDGVLVSLGHEAADEEAQRDGKDPMRPGGSLAGLL